MSEMPQQVALNQIIQGDSFKLIQQVSEKSVNLLITDPPYFLNTTTKKDVSAGINGEAWDDARILLETDPTLKAEYADESTTTDRRLTILSILKQKFFEHLLEVIEPKMADDSAMIVFNRYANVQIMRNWLKKSPKAKDKWIVDSTFEWAKTNPQPTLDPKYWSEYALIVTNSFATTQRTIANLSENYVDNTTIDNTFVTTRPKNKSYVYGDNGAKHATPKPFDLWSYLIRRFSNPEDLLLDPFSGSGTTAITATDLGRNFYAFELDQKQFNASSKRLADFKKNRGKSIFLGLHS